MPEEKESHKGLWIGLGIIVAIVLGIIIGVAYSSSATQQGNVSNNGTNPSVQTQPPAQAALQQSPSSTNNYVSNNLPNTPTSIDQQSVNQGWIVVPLAANQVVQLNTSFDDTITSLGQTIPQGSLSWAPLSSYSATTGEYVQVNLTVNNLGLNTEGLEVVFAGLFDQAGRYYSYQMGNSTCGDYGATEGTQTLSPDIPCVMNGLFEVGKDSNSFTAKFYIKKVF